MFSRNEKGKEKKKKKKKISNSKDKRPLSKILHQTIDLSHWGEKKSYERVILSFSFSHLLT